MEKLKLHTPDLTAENVEKLVKSDVVDSYAKLMELVK